MRCAIMQPTYLPWIGFFDLIDAVDIFVLLDNVKVEKVAGKHEIAFAHHPVKCY